MHDDFDDYLDTEMDDDSDPGPDSETPDYIAEVLGRIASCDLVMWSSGAWCVELTLTDDSEVELDLTERELAMLADQEPLVAAECDMPGAMSDLAERASERSQMGFSDF